MEERLGWLSPLGEFYETAWGKHGKEAENILQEIVLLLFRKRSIHVCRYCKNLC